MKQLRSLTLLLLVLVLGQHAAGQTTLTLEECYSLAEQNYPKIKQLDLIQQSTQYSLDNASKRFLPQVSINGQATYQSDVTSLPIALPGIEITPPPNDQYKVYGELNQPITDLLMIKRQKELVEANGQLKEQELSVELYGIKERINQLYFGILLIDAQLRQTDVLKKELASSKERLQSAIDNGVSINSNLALLEIESIKADQRIIEMKASKKAFLQMLGEFISQEIPEETVLKEPTQTTPSLTLNRPELSLFKQQKSMLEIQSDLVTARNLPHLGFFFQGGYGRPALNFLSSEFDAYYITGLRLNWSVSGYYTMNKEKKIIEINQQLIDVQQETFEFNTNIQTNQQSNEIEQFRKLIEKDQEIIALHESIITTSKSQLENGTITTIDYISTINAMDQARLNQSVHEVQLLMAQQKIQLITGN